MPAGLGCGEWNEDRTPAILQLEGWRTRSGGAGAAGTPGEPTSALPSI